MGPPLGFRGIFGPGRVEFALEVPVAEPVDGEVAGQHRGEQRGGVRVDRVEGGDAGAGCRARSASANRSHSAVIGPKSSTAVILLSLRRYPMPAWSICRASHSRPLTEI